MASFNLGRVPLFVLKLVGNVICIVILMSASVIEKVFTFVVDQTVALTTLLTQAQIDRDKIPMPYQRLKNDEVAYVEDSIMEEGGKPQIIDEVKTFKKVKIGFSDGELIQRCQALILSNFGTKNPELLAEDFKFVFPVVGPLEKTEFCTIFSSFKLTSAFPDSQANYFGFTLDPTEPNRVWFMSRARMTHTGQLKIGSTIIEPSGKVVEPCPQILSMSFDKEGRCYKFTGGYPVDRTVGNTGGLGGVFGIVYALGKSLPFPEALPWQPSFRWQVFYKRIPQIQTDFKNLWS